MSEPFLGEIELFAFPFAPKGWATCSGQTMPINQNQALFALLGTTYGGDGRSTFALPDLRGRVAIGQGQGAQLSPRAIGDTGGEENHGLTTAELPAHTHAVGAVGKPSSTAVIGPAGNLLSVGAGRNSGGQVAVNVYGSGTPGVAMHASTIGASPGAQAHENMMPFSVMTSCIALVGIFPSRP
jgi:microcystin-dependent protein